MDRLKHRLLQIQYEMKVLYESYTFEMTELLGEEQRILENIKEHKEANKDSKSNN